MDGVPYRLEFSNDLADWTTLVSNPFGGAMALDDWDVFSGPARFYRVVVPNLQPLLTILPQFGSGFRVYAGEGRELVRRRGLEGQLAVGCERQGGQEYDHDQISTLSSL